MNFISIIVPISKQDALRFDSLPIHKVKAKQMLYIGNTALTQKSTTKSYIHAPQIRSRAQAMNLGAQHAKHDWLLFLHCDCSLSLEEISEGKLNKKTAYLFTKEYKSKNLMLLWAQRMLELTSKKSFFGLTGTNGLLIHKKKFYELKEFSEEAAFEDLDFIRKTKKSYAVLEAKISVSDRTYKKKGYLKTLLSHAILAALFSFSLPETYLRKARTCLLK